MNGSHTMAVEKRLDWQRWAQERVTGVRSCRERVDDIGGRDRTKEWLRAMPSYLYALSHGETFFMNSKFGSMVNHAQDAVLDNLAFDSSTVVTPHGWMWLEEPIQCPSMKQETIDGINSLLAVAKMMTLEDVPVMKVRSIGWFPVDENGNTLAIPTPGCRYHVACFMDVADYHSGSIGFECWSYFTISNGQTLSERILDFEQHAAEGRYEEGEWRKHEICWIYCAFYLMSQRLAVTVEHRVDRHARRRAEKAGRECPEFIRVVTLRRMEEARKSVPGGAPVDWNWQWEVRGHWRNQFYPATQTHKAVFVEAYMKGPDDKPIKPPGHKLFVAAR